MRELHESGSNLVVEALRGVIVLERDPPSASNRPVEVTPLDIFKPFPD